MTTYLPNFSHNFQLAARGFCTSCPKQPYNVTSWSVHQLQNLSLSLSTDRGHQYPVPDPSCRAPITSSHEGIGIRFLIAKRHLGNFILPKDLGLFITPSILFGKLSGKKSKENLSPCQRTETPSGFLFSPSFQHFSVALNLNCLRLLSTQWNFF